MSGVSAERAFSLARPPGHHAARRVAIVDWDVHHGNGTQRSFEATDDELLCLHHRIIAPVLEAFAPDLILISAGFDAHVLDDASGQRITADGFARVAALLVDVADRVCGGRVALVLEGGYHLDGLADSVEAVLEAALDPARFLAWPPPVPTGVQAAVLESLVEFHGEAWPSLRRP